MKKVFVIVTSLLIFVSFLALWQYFFCPVYRYPAPEPFKGKLLYNPYKEMQPGNWFKGNFHVHTRSWGGITDGRKNSSEKIDSIYTFLDYDIIGISDYQKINTFLSRSSSYIPEYEHGYNLMKNHHIVLNPNSITWYDYLLPQTLDNEQDMLFKIRKNGCSLLAMAHPSLRNAVHLNDMKYLSGYDLIEALNANQLSLEYWDEALSSGHKVFILSDDDAHDVNNDKQFARCMTLINCKENTPSNVLSAMGQGCHIGFLLYRRDDDRLNERKSVVANLTELLKFDLHQDSISIALSKEALRFRFIGQNGKMLSESFGSSTGAYQVKAGDTYVRTEILLADSSVMYLNPVFRYESNNTIDRLSIVDVSKTWLMRLFGAILVVLIIYIRKMFNKRFAKNG